MPSIIPTKLIKNASQCFRTEAAQYEGKLKLTFFPSGTRHGTLSLWRRAKKEQFHSCVYLYQRQINIALLVAPWLCSPFLGQINVIVNIIYINPRRIIIIRAGT